MNRGRKKGKNFQTKRKLLTLNESVTGEREPKNKEKKRVQHTQCKQIKSMANNELNSKITIILCRITVLHV